MTNILMVPLECWWGHFPSKSIYITESNQKQFSSVFAKIKVSFHSNLTLIWVVVGMFLCVWHNSFIKFIPFPFLHGAVSQHVSIFINLLVLYQLMQLIIFVRNSNDSSGQIEKSHCTARDVTFQMSVTYFYYFAVDSSMIVETDKRLPYAMCAM